MAAPYNSLEGIKNYLTDLDGLLRLIKDRQEAGYVRKEHLDEFVVLGHWRTDTCGNFGKCRFEHDYGPPPVGWTFPRQGLPVIRMEDLWEVLGAKDHWSISSGFKSEVPHACLVCAECGKGWTLENAHDAKVRHEDRVVPLVPGKTILECQLAWEGDTTGVFRFGPEPSVRNAKYIDTTPHPKYADQVVNEAGWRHRHTAFNDARGFGEHLTRDYVAEEGDECSITVFIYEHTRCQSIRRARQEREFFVDLFKEAGMVKAVLNEIPNGYWPKHPDYAGMPPWFLARMPYGDIKIGWRKRVISIDWSDTKKTLSQLFKDEDVTKEDFLVHAWGRDKAIEYLKRLQGALT